MSSHDRCYVCVAVYDTHVVHHLRPVAVLNTDTCYVCIAVYVTHVVHGLRTVAVLSTDTCYVFIAVCVTHVVRRCRRSAVLPIPSTAFSTTVLASLWTRTDLRCPNCCLFHFIWSSLRKRRASRNQQELYLGVSGDEMLRKYKYLDCRMLK